MEPLYSWSARAADHLAVPTWTGSPEAVKEILDLAKVTAHGVARPAAPVGSFLAGIAVGLSGAGSIDELRRIRALLEAIVPEAPTD